MASATDLARTIPADVTLAMDDRIAVLEIALLAIASDGEIHADEKAALLTIAKRLGVDGVSLLARLDRGRTRTESDARLREVATTLRSSEARALAYRAAYVLSLADATSSDGEFEFDLQLIDALELPQAEADRLTAEVDAELAAAGQVRA